MSIKKPSDLEINKLLLSTDKIEKLMPTYPDTTRIAPKINFSVNKTLKMNNFKNNTSQIQLLGKGS